MDCPDDITIYPGETTPAPFTSFAQFVAAGGSAWDNCGLVETSFRMINETRDGEHPQIITRTYEIKDSCNNRDECTQILEVYDESQVMMICPPTIMLECGKDQMPEPYQTYSEYIAAGGYAESSPFPIDPATFTIVSEISDNNSCPETITRTYSVANTNGDVVTCQQLIIINDVTRPILRINPKLIECIGELPIKYRTQNELQGPGQGFARDE